MNHLGRSQSELTDLHTTAKAEDEVESGLLLDVVVAQSATILELLASEDQTLLIRWNAFLVLDLGLDVVDGIGRLHLKGDGLAGQGLDEDLHDGPLIAIRLSDGSEYMMMMMMGESEDSNEELCWWDVKREGIICRWKKRREEEEEEEEGRAR
jgi:hypothetical protein